MQQSREFWAQGRRATGPCNSVVGASASAGEGGAGASSAPHSPDDGYTSATPRMLSQRAAVSTDEESDETICRTQ